ncbi:hypothetical protein F4811DRAFT_538185 [Daldinia bambusicola]|nr:hypothetical protein F4811DRAFT_538185 [Daldinia bambusicola]
MPASTMAGVAALVLARMGSESERLERVRAWWERVREGRAAFEERRRRGPLAGTRRGEVWRRDERRAGITDWIGRRSRGLPGRVMLRLMLLSRTRATGMGKGRRSGGIGNWERDTVGDVDIEGGGKVRCGVIGRGERISSVSFSELCSEPGA